MSSHFPFQGDRSGAGVSGLGNWSHLILGSQLPEIHHPTHLSLLHLSHPVLVPLLHAARNARSGSP